MRDDNGLVTLFSLTSTLAFSTIAFRVGVALEWAERVAPAEDADGSALLREVARRLVAGGGARRRRLEAVPAENAREQSAAGLPTIFCHGVEEVVGFFMV